MPTDWFERLFGFHELDYWSTREKFEVQGHLLASKVNGIQYQIGSLQTQSLSNLRYHGQAAIRQLAGNLQVSCASGDVRHMHADVRHSRSVFQVASQFNLLEMVGPQVTPEDGVTRYAKDATQGPACSIAAGAATVFRNYFMPVDGQLGQTRDQQIDCLQEMGKALGNKEQSHWIMQNGYALCTENGLDEIDSILKSASVSQVDNLRDLLHVGFHRDVEVTDAIQRGLLVSQVFCSALPVSYSSITTAKWKSFASLILEGAFEATLLAAAINAASGGSRIVFLTDLGAGAFGNQRDWVTGAQQRALDMFGAVSLDVRLVSLSTPPKEHRRLAARYSRH